MLTDLFTNIAARLRNENSLSDVTWAFAKSHPQFLKLFVEFFDLSIDQKLSTEIYREYPLGTCKIGTDTLACRPDWVIENGSDSALIIENKIDDRNYHFEQYHKAAIEKFKKTGFALIANHNLDSTDLLIAAQYQFQVRTWKDFYDYLNNIDGKEGYSVEIKDLLKLYMVYIKEVLNMVDIRAIKLNCITSLYHLNVLIKEIIETYNDDQFICKIYNGAKSHWENFSGQYFEVYRDGSEKSVYAWLGIYFESDPCIFFEIAKKWNEDIYMHYKNKTTAFDNVSISSNSEEIGFEMTTEKYIEFSTSDLVGQKEILSKLFDAFVNEMKSFL